LAQLKEALGVCLFELEFRATTAGERASSKQAEPPAGSGILEA
jgi:hypothetical protein